MRSLRCPGLSLALFGCLVSLPARAGAAVPDGRVEAARAFVGQLVAGEYPAAAQSFDATMTAAMPAAKLGELWQGIIASVGPFRQQGDVTTSSLQGYDIVIVTCQFERAALGVRTVFDAAGKIAGMQIVEAPPSKTYDPPPYVQVESFREEQVSFGSTDWPLPGTLTIPRGDGPFPAVVLVHGSGPQDRDETIGPNKPFRDLAWGLASNGIAVLRYDKRTQAHQARMAAITDGITVDEETVDDALAAAALLRGRGEIAPAKVFALGHSLGGMLIPRIGQRDGALAGLIIMAGTTRPFEDVTIEQVEYILSLQDEITDEARTALEDLKAQALRAKDPNLSAATPRDQLPLGIPASYWLDLRAYDPVKEATTLTQRALVLQGGRDYQVTEVDFDGWKRGFAGRCDVQFRLYPDLNHLFAEGVGKATPAEYAKVGHVAQQVICDIAEWVGR